MGINAAAVAHRWANKDFGRRGTLTAGSCHCYGRNYYSYSTVFGQWVDLKKNVVVIFDGDTSVTSSKHKLYKSDFPEDVHVFPYNDGYHVRHGYDRWDGCYLVCPLREDSDFDLNSKMRLLDYYAFRQLNLFKGIKNCSGKGLDRISYECWGYFAELCSLYKKELSPAKYAKYIKEHDLSGDKLLKGKLVKMFGKGERDVKAIADTLFGAGVYDRYMKYNERFAKADNTKARVERICEYLKIASPYVSWWRGDNWNRVQSNLKAAQIRKLTPKERIDIKFGALETLERKARESEINAAKRKREANAFKYVIGAEIKTDRYGIQSSLVEMCTNRFTGELYSLKEDIPWNFRPLGGVCLHISFDYKEYAGSEDKEKWMLDFYKKCEKASNAIKAIKILISADAEHVPYLYGQERWVITDELRAALSDEDMALCQWYVDVQEKFIVDEEARKRARAIAEEKRKAEEEKERELQRQLKQETIDRCLAEGDEGARQLWRRHYMGAWEAIHRSGISENVFYNGGNVLLRFNIDKNAVETSKGIRIGVGTCKKLWKAVQIWHVKPGKFSATKVNTHYSGTYTITSYKNDVLTAGCHKISYAEMERMYNEIIENENGNGDKSV